MRTHYIALGALLVFAGELEDVCAQNIYDSGNSVYGSSVGTTPILEEQEGSKSVVVAPAATVYRKIGDTTYGSDGSTARQIGDATFIRKSAGEPLRICRTIGETTLCN